MIRSAFDLRIPDPDYAIIASSHYDVDLKAVLERVDPVDTTEVRVDDTSFQVPHVHRCLRVTRATDDTLHMLNRETDSQKCYKQRKREQQS